MARQRRKREVQEFTTAEQVVAAGVKALRKRHGITQQELADTLGWPQSTLARVELGERSITVSNFLALAWALDVSPGYLLAGSFQDKPVPVHKTVKAPPAHMLKWIHGGEPLPGLDHRRYNANVPDEEWDERHGVSRAELRERIAEHYERLEAALEAGVTRDDLQKLAIYEPERQAEMLVEREQRRQQLAATRRAGKRKEKSE